MQWRVHEHGSISTLPLPLRCAVTGTALPTRRTARTGSAGRARLQTKEHAGPDSRLCRLRASTVGVMDRSVVSMNSTRDSL